MYKLYDYYEGEDLIAVSDDYHDKSIRKSRK